MAPRTDCARSGLAPVVAAQPSWLRGTAQGTRGTGPVSHLLAWGSRPAGGTNRAGPAAVPEQPRTHALQAGPEQLIFWVFYNVHLYHHAFF